MSLIANEIIEEKKLKIGTTSSQEKMLTTFEIVLKKQEQYNNMISNIYKNIRIQKQSESDRIEEMKQQILEVQDGRYFMELINGDLSRKM